MNSVALYFKKPLKGMLKSRSEEIFRSKVMQDINDYIDYWRLLLFYGSREVRHAFDKIPKYEHQYLQFFPVNYLCFGVHYFFLLAKQ